MLANVTAYVVSQIHNFIWCKYWIFPLDKENKKNTVWHQMLFFAGAFALAYSAQFVFLLVLVELLHCNEYLAQFLGSLFTEREFLLQQISDFPLRACGLSAGLSRNSRLLFVDSC